jgi:hypothetical protein
MPVDILSFVLTVVFGVSFIVIIGESISRGVFLWKPSLMLLIPSILVFWIILSKDYEIEETELPIHTVEGIDFFIDNNKIVNANDTLNRGFSESDKIIKTAYKKHYNNLLLFPEYVEYKVK